MFVCRQLCVVPAKSSAFGARSRVRVLAPHLLSSAERGRVRCQTSGVGRRAGRPISGKPLQWKIGMPDALGWRSPALALVLVLLALRRRVSRVTRIATQRYPMLLSACALALWRWLWDRYRLIAADGPPLPTLPTPEVEVSSPPLERCTNSFTITNERGESRGSLNEKATGGWSWQVDESPVTASIGPQKQPGPVLRRDSGEAEAEAQALARVPSAQAPRGAAAATLAQPVADSPWRRARRSSKVTFQLDQSPGFYGFVFSYDGTCVAHGADDSFVGLSLKQERSTYYGCTCDGCTYCS